MPSCSSSSNIQASLNTISVSQGGSRLFVSIPFVSGLTTGDVIRYDVPTSGFTAARADAAETSEVFGVIESATASTMGVVIYGSVNLDSSKFADMGSGGGSGGNDIYFLSGQTAGVLQNLAPTDLDHIVKPVYQIAPHGSFTGVVINYLGYKIGGDIEASFADDSVGGFSFLVGSGTFDEGYVDASVSHELPIADYPDFYAKYGTQYGYVERLTLDTISGAIAPNNKVTQTTSSYDGTVVSVDYANKYVYVFRAPNTSLASTSKQASITTTSGNVKSSVTATSVYAVNTPIVSLTQPVRITGKSGASITVPQTIKVGLKVSPTGTRVSIPTNATINSLTAQTLLVGLTSGSETDVESTLNNFESRIAAIETRLRM